MSIRALIGALGKAGTGKTTRVRQLAAPCRRLLIADPEGSWEDPDAIVVEGARALFQALRATGALEPARPFRILYRDDAERMAAAAPAAVFATRQCTLLVDELAWLCTPQWAPPELRAIVQFGRARRINILYTTREPQEIHNLFLTQANRLYFFRIERGNGLTRVKRDWPDLAARLPGLREFPAPGRPAEFCTYGNPAIEKLLGREGLDFSAAALLSSRRSQRREQ